MGRMPRNFVSGEIYHIVQRGNNREHIFSSAADKKLLLSIISKVKKSMSFDFLYYVLMDNHYHIIIRMKDDNISDVMQRINWAYSTRFNRKYDRCGTIFGQRFRAYHVKNNKYLRALIKYIALNPVRSKLSAQPEEYKWSAHTDFVLNRNSVADKKLLLGYFDEKHEKAMDAYLHLVKHAPQELNRDDMLDMAFKERVAKLKAFFKTFLSNNINKSKADRSLKKEKLRLIAICINQALKDNYTTKEIAHVLKVDRQRVYNLRSLN